MEQSPQDHALEAVRSLADRLTAVEETLRTAMDHRARMEVNLREAEELLARCSELEWSDAHDDLFGEVNRFTGRRDLYT